MMIIGVDYHPSFQQIALFVKETGECEDRRLSHNDGQAERFYRDLKQSNTSVRVGMEATGYSRWFERLLGELGFELWIGDPAVISKKRVKKQKTDREDARLLLQLMPEDRFPPIWTPVQKIEICDRCFGIAIGWCRCKTLQRVVLASRPRFLFEVRT